MIPKPRFLQKQIGEVSIGTFREIATVQESASVHDALMIFVERRVSALPVVNEEGIVMFKLTWNKRIPFYYNQFGEWTNDG